MSLSGLCLSAGVVIVLWIATSRASTSADYYTAAVVEYAPEYNPSLCPAENIYNNVNNYLTFIQNASALKADIIVFPEEGLIGRGNQVYYSEVPHGGEVNTPCSHNTSSLALALLSCAARTYSIYVVVNLPEVYYNTSSGETKHYNTDVVFDRNGTIIARYRKYNLFGESRNVPELEHVYFETDFGVKFGIFICFDIVFDHPAVSLARDYNISHFVFSLAWLSELPFLTAIQTQWAWAYSLDVVLLASGLNEPSAGSSGSGIYQGRHGPLAYTMTDSRGSKLLWSTVPKNKSIGNTLPKELLQVVTVIRSDENNSLPTNETLKQSSSLRMLQDWLNQFKTVPLQPSNYYSSFEEHIVEEKGKNITEVVTTLELNTTICQRTLCCEFNINMSTTYRQNAVGASRGDDYNQYHYRLAVFDGVRTYSGFATGGVQLCSVIACVNNTAMSCGLRADHVTAIPVVLKHASGNIPQSKVVFNDIHIEAYFADNNSLVLPDVFVTGSGDSFGALAGNSQFEYETLSPENNTAYCNMKSLKALDNLITFGIYSRQFDRDGQDVSPPEIPSSGASHFKITSVIICLLILHTVWTF